MAMTIEIPRDLQLAIAASCRETVVKFMKEVRKNRKKVVLQLRELGLRDREIGDLLGISQQAIFQQFPRPLMREIWKAQAEEKARMSAQIATETAAPPAASRTKPARRAGKT